MTRSLQMCTWFELIYAEIFIQLVLLIIFLQMTNLKPNYQHCVHLLHNCVNKIIPFCLNNNVI